MKKIFFPLLLCAALTLGSCDDDDDLLYVPSNIEAAFSAKYPQHTAKGWERDGKYYKAEFQQNGSNTEAWFGTDGTWIKSETDFYGELPIAVTNYIQTHFAGYHIDEKEWVETPYLNYFKLELEKGESEVELCITEDGTLVEIESETPHIKVPDTVLQHFAELFPMIKQVKWEKDNGLFKAEFHKDGVECETWFDTLGVLTRTETDFKGNLPQPIMDYIAANYLGYTIDDVNLVETGDDTFFEIDLEKGEDEIELTIHEDGTLIKAIPDVD